MESYGQKVDAGSKGAQSRWGTVDKAVAQELRDPSLVQPHPLLNGTAKVQNGEGMADPRFSMATNGNIKNKDQKDVSKNDTSKKSEENTELKEQKTLLPKKRESLFDETKFKITEKMASHLSAKYPEFVAGDWEWLVEKFKNVYYGKRYISWSRTFYNFVANQVTHYGYRSGAFNWRQPELKSQPTAAERNAQAERDADALSRKFLQSEGPGDNQEDSEALPLTAADIRDGP
jgi:hypothetical protein